MNETQGFTNQYSLELKTQYEAEYNPSFMVHVENTYADILRQADWEVESTVSIYCRSDYEDDDSNAVLDTFFERELTIDINLGIPEREALHVNTEALGTYNRLKVLDSTYSHVGNETIESGIYVDYTGSMECYATIDGKATGGGPIVWDSPSEEYLTVTHANGVTSGDTYRILLHDFVYVFNIKIYYFYVSGAITNVYIDASNERRTYNIIPTTITTVTYTPGFGLIMTSIVLILMSLSLIITRYMKKRKENITM